MLDLTTLKFSVNTQELDDALTKVDRLAGAFSKLTPAVTKAEKESVALAKAQAQAAKAAAEAEKAELALAQAKEKTAKASKKKSDADNEVTTATKASITALEKQQQILEYMTQGFSRGQSTILTMAKATGTLTEDLTQLGNVLQTQRKLIGGDPFDKSISGLTALKTQLGEAREANRLYTAGIELTKNQTRELARDKERIIERMKVEGAALTDIKNAIRNHNAEYIAAAGAINRLVQSEQQHQEAAGKTAKATEWVARELARAEAALAGLNNELNVSTSNRLGKFEQQLKASGIAGAEAASMMKRYEESITATQRQQSAKRTKDREEELKYLARATSVQIGDIGVSLAGGQNPFMVLIQQGDQLRQVLEQVGGNSKEMQKAMSLAFSQIITGAIDVTKALGSFVVGAFNDAGKAVFDFTMSLTGADKVLAEMTDRFPQFATVTSAVTSIIGISIGAILAGIAAGTVALFQLSKEQTKVAQTNAQFGAAFGATTQEILGFNAELSKLNVTSSQASEIFVEVAKAGNIGKESFVSITKSAADFETWVGGKASDAVKTFSDAMKDPVKELTEFGLKTGFVSLEQIQLVKNLIESGKAAEAQEVAIQALNNAYAKMSEEARNNMSTLDRVITDLKISMSNLWDEFKNSRLVTDLGNVFRMLMGWVAGVTFTINAMITGIRAIPASAAAVVHDLANAVGIARGTTKSMLAQVGNDLTKELDASAQGHATFISRMVEGNAKLEDSAKKTNQEQIAGAKALSDLKDRIDKSVGKDISRQEFINRGLESARRARGNAIKDSEQLAEATKLELKLAEALGKEWDKAQKKPAKAKQDKTEAKAIETLWQSITDSVNKANVAYDEVVNGADKYTDSQKKMMSIIDNKAFLAMPESLQKEALARLAVAHAIEVQTSELKAFDKATADYWSEYEKQQERKKEFTTKELADGEIRLAMLDEELAGLLAQKAIYGKLSIEQKQAVENAKAEAAYRKEILEIERDLAAGKLTAEGALDRTFQAIEARAKRLRNISVGKDLEEKKYYESIEKGIESAIVDGLINGAESGAKAFADIISNVVKKQLEEAVNGALKDSGAGKFITENSGYISAGLSLTKKNAQGGRDYGSAAGEALGFAFGGPIGAAIGKALGKALKLVDYGGTYHSGGLGSYSSAGGVAKGLAVQAQGLDFNLAKKDFTSQGEKAAVDVAKGIVQILDNTSKTFGKEFGYYAATAFADDISPDGAWGALMIKLGEKLVIDWGQGADAWPGREFANGEAGITGFNAAVAKDVRQILIDMNLPEWASDVLKAIGEDPSMEDLTNAMQTINDMPAAILTSIGTSTEALSDIILLGLQNGDPEGAGKAFAEQITFGIENSLYQGFAQQITSIISTQLVTPVITAMAKGATITEAMSKASVETMISQVKAAGTAFAAIMNNPEFRAAMDSIGATISGAVSGSFSGIPAAPAAPVSYADSFKAAKEAKESTKTASKETDDLAKSLKSLADENTKLQAEYLELTGKTAEAKAMLRALAIEGMSELEIAAYDSNQALRDKIELYKKEQQALESFWSAVERNLSKFMQGDDLRFGRSIFLAQDLNKAGVGTGNLMNDARTLMQLSTKQIKELASAFVLSAENSVEAKTAVLDVAGALIDLADAAANEALKSLVDFYDMLQSNAEKATDKAFAVLEKSIGSLIKNIEDEQKAIEESIKTKEKAIDSIKEVFDVLKNSAAALYNSVTSTNKAEVNKASKFISDALLTALQTGVLPDAKDLEKAIGLVTADLDATQFKTKFDADKQRILLANMLTEFQGLASDQLTDAEKQLAVSNDQLKELENLKVAAQEQLEHWRTQVELARGTYIETIAVKDAINALAAALGVEAQVKADAAKNVIKGAYGGSYDIKKDVGMTSSGASFVGSQTKDAAVLHLTQGGSAKQIYDVIQGSGFSLAQAEKILGATPGSFAAEAAKMGLPAFADGGLHSGGVRLVGEEGPELEVTGPARYYSASQTASMLSGNSDKEELEMLRYEVRAVAQHSAKLTRTIERLIVGTNDGEALQTKAVV